MARIIRSKTHIIGTIAVILIVLGILLMSRPVKAEMGIESAKDGAATWFYQSCEDTEAKDVAATVITLDAKDPSGQTLRINTTNGYPGYRFHCTVSLANTGDSPVHLADVAVNNPYSSKLMVSAQPDAFQMGKTLEPCGATPAWGTLPDMVSDDCRASIALDVLVLPDAGQKIIYGYAVTVSLE